MGKVEDEEILNWHIKSALQHIFQGRQEYKIQISIDQDLIETIKKLA